MKQSLYDFLHRENVYNLRFNPFYQFYNIPETRRALNPDYQKEFTRKNRYEVFSKKSLAVIVGKYLGEKAIIKFKITKSIYQSISS